MVKLKAKWVKTDIPKAAKIKLWRLMKDNPTFDSFQGQVSKEFDKIFVDVSKKQYKYGFLSRDTYNALQYEIIHIPDDEVASLPPDLQGWINSLARQPVEGGSWQEPTDAELQFIYSRIAEGKEDAEILEDMKCEESFLIRTLGFIKLKRKEYAAAKSVMEGLMGARLDPTVFRQRMRHWNDSAEAARNIWRNIRQVRDGVGDLRGDILSGSLYTYRSPGAKQETPLTRVNSVVASGLLTHLQAEFAEFNRIQDWSTLSKLDLQILITHEMLQHINLVGRRRTFTGSCIICGDWNATPVRNLPSSYR